MSFDSYSYSQQLLVSKIVSGAFLGRSGLTARWSGMSRHRAPLILQMQGTADRRGTGRRAQPTAAGTGPCLPAIKIYDSGVRSFNLFPAVGLIRLGLVLLASFGGAGLMAQEHSGASKRFEFS